MKTTKGGKEQITTNIDESQSKERNQVPILACHISSKRKGKKAKVVHYASLVHQRWVS